MEQIGLIIFRLCDNGKVALWFLCSSFFYSPGLIFIKSMTYKQSTCKNIHADCNSHSFKRCKLSWPYPWKIVTCLFVSTSLKHEFKKQFCSWHAWFRHGLYTRQWQHVWWNINTSWNVFSVWWFVSPSLYSGTSNLREQGRVMLRDILVLVIFYYLFKQTFKCTVLLCWQLWTFKGDSFSPPNSSY